MFDNRLRGVNHYCLLAYHHQVSGNILCILHVREFIFIRVKQVEENAPWSWTFDPSFVYLCGFCHLLYFVINQKSWTSGAICHYFLLIERFCVYACLKCYNSEPLASVQFLRHSHEKPIPKRKYGTERRLFRPKKSAFQVEKSAFWLKRGLSRWKDTFSAYTSSL